MRFVFPAQLENFVLYVDGKQDDATVLLECRLTGYVFPCLLKPFANPPMDWMCSCLPKHCPMTDSDIEELILWASLPVYPDDQTSLLNWQLAEDVFWMYRKLCN